MPPHQRRVLLMLVTGLAEKQIADQLEISVNTAHQMSIVPPLWRAQSSLIDGQVVGGERSAAERSASGPYSIAPAVRLT